MPLKKWLMIYLSGYLFFGGLAFALVPDFFLTVLQSNGDYGDIMPRLVGMFMVGLGAMLGLMVYRDDYTYYRFSVVIRTVFVVFLTVLYFMSDDPLFLVFNLIVLVGLVPSYFVVARERSSQ